MDRRAFLISMAAVTVPTWPRPSRIAIEPSPPPALAEWDFTAEVFEEFEARARRQRDEVA